MEENYDDHFNYRIHFEEELYNSTEKSIDNENNEKKDVDNNHDNNHVNNVNNSTSNINNNNENLYNNVSYNNEKQINNNLYSFYPNEIIQNDHKYNNKNLNQNETCLNFGEVFLNNQNFIEQNDNKKTFNTSNTIQMNGKQINTTNEVITGALIDIFNSGDMNIENKADMQLLRKKKRRRTKKEINEENKIKNDKIKIPKKLGRKKKNEIEKDITNVRHSKKADDNIIKKINSYYLDSILNWINKSFIDKNRNFQSIIERQKINGILRKIDPTIITTNLKKQNVIKIRDFKFKDIFYNKISTRFIKHSKDENKLLIDKIYKEKNQPFVIFILELTFSEAFNYFNGQNKGEDLRNFFLSQNYSEEMVNQFLNNFDTVRNFLSTINDKENNQNSEVAKDYIQRVGILCLNYYNFFEKKFDRRENKTKSKKV